MKTETQDMAHVYAIAVYVIVCMMIGFVSIFVPSITVETMLKISIPISLLSYVYFRNK